MQALIHFPLTNRLEEETGSKASLINMCITKNMFIYFYLFIYLLAFFPFIVLPCIGVCTLVNYKIKDNVYFM